MNELKDMLDTPIEVGDPVVFGKSNRHNPINVGIVKEIKQEDGWNTLYIQGKGNSRISEISWKGATDRVVVLPYGYTEDCGGKLHE